MGADPVRYADTSPVNFCPGLAMVGGPEPAKGDQACTKLVEVAVIRSDPVPVVEGDAAHDRVELNPSQPPVVPLKVAASPVRRLASELEFDEPVVDVVAAADASPDCAVGISAVAGMTPMAAAAMTYERPGRVRRAVFLPRFRARNRPMVILPSSCQESTEANTERQQPGLRTSIVLKVWGFVEDKVPAS
jgi:hypothetical protein